MSEKVVVICFSIGVSILFLLNFNNRLVDKGFEKAKSRQLTWFWIRLFKSEETKENYVKMVRGFSIFVISVMLLTIVMTLIQ